MNTKLYTTEELVTVTIAIRKEIAAGYFVRANYSQLAEIREELKRRGESLEVTTVTKYDVVC
jgi:hypothetical protein